MLRDQIAGQEHHVSRCKPGYAHRCYTAQCATIARLTNAQRGRADHRKSIALSHCRPACARARNPCLAHCRSGPEKQKYTATACATWKMRKKRHTAFPNKTHYRLSNSSADTIRHPAEAVRSPMHNVCHLRGWNAALRCSKTSSLASSCTRSQGEEYAERMGREIDAGRA